MHIMLAYPPFLLDRVHTENIDPPPIGMMYVGALLMAHGHDVSIANMHQAGKNPGIMEQVLRENRPDLLGISIFHANRFGGVDLAGISKQVHPEVPVVLGGIGATFLDELLLTHFPDIDAIVRGEGEHAMLELVQALEQGKGPKEWTHIQGLSLRGDDGVIRTQDRPALENLDDLPNPAQFFTYQHLALTRGCPGNCTFCGSPRFWGRKVRSHSAKYFVDQMELLRDKDVSFFYVSDDTFTLNKDLVIEVCQEIINRELDVTWAAISRVDAVGGERGEEMLAWMRKAGCIQLSFGVESGSEDVRRALGKKTSQDAIREAFSKAAAHAILARAYIIYGCPGDGEDSLQANLELLQEIQPLIVLFHVLAIFPGTQLWEDVKTRLSLTDDIWLERIEDILYFQTVPDMEPEALMDYGRRLKTEYFRMLPEFAQNAASGFSEQGPNLPAQADFLSRLGMTFHYGDYSHNEHIPDKMETARDLYTQALERHPDRRAFFGLAVVHQSENEHESAVDILQKALAHYPDDEELIERLAGSYMDLGKLESAVDLLAPLTESSRAMQMAAECCRALGDSRASEFRRRYLELP